MVSSPTDSEAATLRHAKARGPLASTGLRLLGTLATIALLLVLLVLAVGHLRKTLLLIALFALFGAGFLVLSGLFVGTHVAMGSDGFTLQWGGLVRHISFASIRALHLEVGRSQVLHVEQFDKHRIHLVFPRPTPGLRSAGDRIADLYEACGKIRRNPRLEGRLLLAERDLDAWLDDLRAIGVAAYRQSEMETEKDVLSESSLWGILDCPGAIPESRLGAALALRGAAAVNFGQDLRALAEHTTHPKLREALLRMAAGETDDASVAQRYFH